MSRCKHPECVISETAQLRRQYHFIDGHFDAYGSRHFKPTGRIYVHCSRCGLGRFYSAGSWPKWVAMLMAAIPKELRE